MILLQPTMADEPMNEDPGLGEDPAATQEPMPSENTQAGAVNDPEENPGFGEGTDPMPGASETTTDDVNTTDDEDDMTNGQ